MTVATRPPDPPSALVPGAPPGTPPSPAPAPAPLGPGGPAPDGRAGPPAAAGTVIVRPWRDEVIDALGFDPRSPYVERYWLGILGPSTTWLLRRIAAELEASPAGFELDLADAACRLGLGARLGSDSPFARALMRCVHFGMARQEGPGNLGVRRKLPPLTRRQLMRLPTPLQAEHQRWQDAERDRPEVDRIRQRSRRLALSLLELGEDLEATERQLLRWRFHPALAREAAAWAWDRHRSALAAATAAAATTPAATTPPAAAATTPAAPAVAFGSGGDQLAEKEESSSMRVRTPNPVPPLRR